MGSQRILGLVDGGGFACRRQWPRQLMLLSARLLTTTGDRVVRIRDISRGGARIEGADLPEQGTDVLLKRGPFEAFGTIAWLSGTQAGMAFDGELDDDAFEALETAGEESGAIRAHGQGFGCKRRGHARWSDGSGWIEL